MSFTELNEIREFYEFLTPIIFESAEKSIKKWVDPYFSLNWQGVFSPIEKDTWWAIRQFGHAPMYPQYPVFNYFIDFANPVLRIALECDGKEFHKDRAKDLKRDTELVEKGWVVYRIPGSNCVLSPKNDYYNIDVVEDKEKVLTEFYDKTIDGTIKALGIVHFDYKLYYKKPNELAMARSILKRRRSI